MKSDFGHIPLTGWYPGHMLKAGREIQQRLKLVDAVVELLDARTPSTSKNPAFAKLFGDKPRFLVFNKADLVTREYADAWVEELRDQAEHCVFIDSLHSRNLNFLVARWKEFVEVERRRRGAKLQLHRPVRLLIAGIPNIGKSTLVNRLVESKRAAVGPRPGVTRNQQWVRLKQGVELLDTPGVLWPKFNSKIIELKLGLIGTIKDELIGEELLVDFLLEYLRKYPENVNWDLYDLDGCPANVEEFLDSVGERRGLLRGGGEIDRQQSAVLVLKDYRDGRLGKIPLDPMPNL